MTKTKKIIAAFVLFDFAVLNIWALATVGLQGLIPALTETNMVGHVLHVDLVIALSMVLVWLWRDAKETGRNPWGYTLLTFATGSIGPLLYVLLSKSHETAEATDELAEGNEEAMDLGDRSVSAGAR